MSSDLTPSVAVIVVNWNAAELTESCLESLQDSDYPREQMTIIVVDNGSTDDSLSRLDAQFGEVAFVALAENLGFGAGVNAGLSHAAAEIVILVNNDAVVEPGTVSAFVEAVLSAGPRVAAVTGLLVLASRYRPAPPEPPMNVDALVGFDGKRWVPTSSDDNSVSVLVNSTGNEVTVTGNGRDRDWLTPLPDLSAVPEVFGFCGGAVAFRRAALLEVGDFDASLFMYYEDTELSWRFRRAGWAIAFCREAVVHHHHAASSGTHSDVFLRYNARNRVLVAVRHAPAAVAWRAVVRGVFRSLREALGGGDRGRRGRWVLGQFARKLPGELRQRRSVESRSLVSRAEIAHWLVAEL